MIYQLFSAPETHHVPYMIDVFNRFYNKMGLSKNEQIFVVCNITEQFRNAYEKLNLDPTHLILMENRRIKSFFLNMIGHKDLLIIHGNKSGWGYLFLLPHLWRQTALILWGAGRERGFPPEIKETENSTIMGVSPLIADRKFEVNSQEYKLKEMLPRLCAVSTPTPKEFRMIENIFGKCGNYFPVTYNYFSPDIKTDYCENKSGPVKVMVGNSGWSSNGHIEALIRLARYRDEYVEILCPLGYPPEQTYAQHVINIGTRLFRGLFLPHTEMMPKAEYTKLLQSIDVFVLNAKRQQGLYCVYTCLLTGKKIFLSTLSPTYEMLTAMGFKIFDIETISSLSFPEFCYLSHENRTRNMSLADQHFGMESALSTWKDLFAKMKSQIGNP